MQDIAAGLSAIWGITTQGHVLTSLSQLFREIQQDPRVALVCVPLPKRHQYAVKQGEHYFENYSQTVRWPNIRAICAQACINGFTYAKQIDTGAAFLFEANELGTQVLVRVPKELQCYYRSRRLCMDYWDFVPVSG